MGLLRRGAKDGPADEPDDDVYVVSPKAASHAVKAEKAKRRAARAERKLAEKQLETVGVVEETVASGEELSPKEAKKAAKKAKKGKGKKDAGPEPVTGATVKRWIGIARVVVPVVAPLVYQAVGEARARWDDHRARQLGVAPDELADFSGRGAALYARLHRAALSLRDLRTRRSDDREAMAFAGDAEGRLADLEAAVRSAEQMPASRRRSAHAAVAEELTRIETRMLAFLGVDGASGTPGTLPAGSPVDTTSRT